MNLKSLIWQKLPVALSSA
uniref:Uncharacterized protein n=1 Tax=Anguilla anguilla TaxID=7936 RepID=A0A0E9UE23_ANGAN